MSYQTVFDISTDNYKEWPYLIITIGLVFANVIVFFFFRESGFRFPLLAISALVVLFTFLVPYWDYSRLKNAFLQQKYQVVEGKVENYWQKEWYDRLKKRSFSYESYTINGITFSYYRSVAAAGFHNDGANRLPIRNGMIMRIYYLPEKQVDNGKIINRILKLEVGQS